MAKQSLITDLFAYLFAAALGGVCMAFLVNSSYQGMMSRNWTETTAEIFVSRTERQKNMTYVPVIAYRYEVNGVTYKNSKISYGPTGLPFFTSETDVDNFRSAYQKGSLITIYYDPRSPEYSCIIKGTHYIAYPITGVFIFLLIAFGIHGLYQTIRRQ